MNTSVTWAEQKRQSRSRAITFAQLGAGEHAAADAASNAISLDVCASARPYAAHRREGHAVGQAASMARPISMAAMQETERRRIAADLHDSIGQSLSALSFGIGAALDSIARGDLALTSERLKKLSLEIKASMLELQRIGMNLRPVMLDDKGLIATLAWFVRELGVTHPRLTLNAAVAIAECDVPPALRMPIFRVVQEASQNIVKHSGASEMRLRLYRVDGEVRLEISDNGVGFAKPRGGKETFGGGMGVRGMRERTEICGGRFRLLSAPGKGTRVSVAWPAQAGTGTP